MERVIPENSTGLMCNTYHLSIFGAVSGFISDIGKEFASLIECSNAGSLFTAKAAAKIFQGAPRRNASQSKDGEESEQDAAYLWWKGGPALCLWTSLAVLGVCLAVASWVDIRDAQRLKKARMDEVRSAEMKLKRLNSSRGDEGEVNSAMGYIRLLVGKLLHLIVSVLGGACSSLIVIWKLLIDLPNGPQKMVTNAVTKVQAFHLRVDEDSMEDMVKVQFKRGSSVEQLASKVDSIRGDRCLGTESDYSMERFLEGSLLQRMLWLFLAAHPIFLVLSFSLRLSHLARMFLIVVKIASAGACTAILYQSTGALSAVMPPECFEERGAFRELVKSFLSGIFCSLLSDGMLGMLIAIRGEQCPELAMSQDGDADEETGLLSARKTALIKLMLFWLVGASYVLLSVYVMICYLANVGYDDALGFVHAYVVVFIEDFLIEPSAIAVILGVASSIVLCCSRDVIYKVKGAKRQISSSRRAAAFEGISAGQGAALASDLAEDTDQNSRPSSARSDCSFPDDSRPENLFHERRQQLAGILPEDPEDPSSRFEMKAKLPGRMVMDGLQLEVAIDQSSLPGQVSYARTSQ
eukprot:TRINITY_DN20765_c0_g1_i1.p1 TRINITY_DN20765_c0_g1~~TRINITY_DN20765_c0_g1_i1.p1  ORF type:complete len:609 (+),score=98.86 TRINITY_DN20765_c0_g1_i1:90-1829(+)